LNVKQKSMAKTIGVKQKKRRGRPETGHQFIGLRVPPATMTAVDQWANTNRVARSEAVRRLVELGLLAKGPGEMKTREPGSRAKRAAKAAELAGRKIDQLADKSAPDEVRAQRKQRLVKGPSEFREMRDEARRATVKKFQG
jgi:hypothetical protein